MTEPQLLAIASSGGIKTATKDPLCLLLKMANRHGLIAGTTGSQLGRQLLVRGIMGSLLGGRR